MAYTCKDLTIEEVLDLERTGVLKDLYLKSEKYLDGDKNFNYANCELTTEQFNNLTQEQKLFFWNDFPKAIGRIFELVPFEEPSPVLFKSLAMQDSDGYILHLYNGYIDNNTWVEERGLIRPDASGSRAYTYTNDFWTPKYTYLKSLGVTKMNRIVETDSKLATLLANPDSYSHNSHLDTSTIVVEDKVSSYAWADITHKHITIDLI